MLYIFAILCAMSAALLPVTAYAHTYQASTQVNNLIITACWSYGISYIAIAGIKFFKARPFQNKSHDNPERKSGGIFFAISAIYLLIFPFIQQMLQGSIPYGYEVPASNISKGRLLDLAYALVPVFVAMVLIAPFFPWLMLIFSKKLSHLRKQGIRGLCMMPLIPLVFFAIILLLFRYLPMAVEFLSAERSSSLY